MKIKFVIPAALAMGAMSALPAFGQANATDFQGFASRGIAMYDDNNYIGCIDQLSHALTLAPALRDGCTAVEDVDYYLAMATLYAGSNDTYRAEELLEAFLKKYPASLRREDVRFSLANIVFSRHKYIDALAMYDAIDPWALTGARRMEYNYNRGICLLKKAAYADAADCFNRLLGSREYGNAARFYLGYVDYATDDYDAAIESFDKVNTAIAPGDMTNYYLSQIYYARGEYDEALTRARSVLRRHIESGRATKQPGNDNVLESRDIPAIDTYMAEANRIAGESLYRLGSPSQAIPYLAQYVSAVSNPQPSALYVLGLSEYSSGDYRKAIEYLQPVVEGQPDAMVQSAYLYIGQSQLHLGNNSAAILAFDKALDLGFDRDVKEAAYYNYAVTRFKGGTVPFGNSAATFEEFLKQFPTSPYADEVRGYLVNGYIAEKDYDSALKALDRAASSAPQNLATKRYVLYCMGSRALAGGNVEQAVDLLLRAAAVKAPADETSAEVQLMLGEAYYALGEYDKAAAAQEAYIAAAANDAHNRPVGYYDLGYTRFSQKRYDDAIKAFKHVTGAPASMADATVADAYSRIGDSHFYRKEFNAAAEAYDKALALDPAVGDYALFQKGLIAGYKRDYKGKIARLDELMESYPSSPLVPDAMLEMTESYLRLGDTSGAIDTYRRLIAAYPSTEQGRQAYLQMALTMRNSGDNAGAMATYKELVRLFPTSDEAAQAVESLKMMCADNGTLAELNDFLRGIKGAPKLDPSQADELTFDAAEKDYLERGNPAKLEAYVAEWEQGKHTAQALAYLAEEYSDSNHDKAYAYASQLVSEYPDNSLAQKGLIVRAGIDTLRGNVAEALESWKVLEQKSSSPATLNVARFGIMRTARELARHEDVIAAADAILSSSVATPEDRNEAVFARGMALLNTGATAKAEADWESISSLTDDINGAKAAYYLAQSRLDRGDIEGARQAVDMLNSSGTPHTYWLGRGFILLSDIFAAQGQDFEAKEYLKALRENYPGNESDIFLMIDQRLSK